MSPVTDSGTTTVLADYRAHAAAHDEFLRLLDLDDQPTVGGLTALDAEGWQARQGTVAKLIGTEAITYGGATPGNVAAPWRTDVLPVVIDAAEWAGLDAGLRQRAELLNAILVDLTGPKRLIRDRIVAGEAVFGHSGFLPAADGITLPGPRQLVMLANDLVRDDDGNWTVLSDRTQAPSGMGYAMANRRLVSRTLEDTYRHAPIHRLRGFFELLRVALEDAAPADVDTPRAVILSPGPASETAYDQALLSTLIGHPVVQSGDLEIDDGRLWLRTTNRREPVHVVLRRVDADHSDSLDLRPESRLGVAGLTQAARSGRVSVANPLISGVLENPALLAGMDRICRFLLGEPLALPVAPTWWCGEPTGLSHTLAALPQLVIKPIARATDALGYPGWELDRAQLDQLRRRILAEPWRWSAQAPLAGSTAPVVGVSGPEPRRWVLRTFGVAAADGYSFMPGGLGRVAPSVDQWVITNNTGAISKDVWVLQERGQLLQPVEIGRRRPGALEQPLPGLPPSTAGNLYWLGRYSERTEATARMLKVSDQLVEDNLARPGTPGHNAMHSMLESLSMATAVPGGFVGPGAAERLADPLPHLRDLLLNPGLRGTVAWNAERTSAAATDVRETISADTFGVLSSLSGSLARARHEPDPHLQPLISDVLLATLAFSGMVGESLVRDSVWAFVEAGRRMERAQTTVRMLRNTLARVTPPVAEALLTESVLLVGDSWLVYRQRMSAGIGSNMPAESALELLLLDAANPRSVRFQLDRLVEALRYAPSAPIDRAASDLAARLRDAVPAELFAGRRAALRELLDVLDSRLRTLSDEIERIHFVTAPSISFSVPEGSGVRA